MSHLNSEAQVYVDDCHPGESVTVELFTKWLDGVCGHIGHDDAHAALAYAIDERGTECRVCEGMRALDTRGDPVDPSSPFYYEECEACQGEGTVDPIVLIDADDVVAAE